MIKIHNKDYIIEGGVVVENTKIFEPLQLNQNYIDMLLQNLQMYTQTSLKTTTSELLTQTIKDKINNKRNQKNQKNKKNQRNIQNNIYKIPTIPKIPQNLKKKKINYILKRIHN